MLKAAQVAEALGLSQRAIYALAESGALPCYRMGVGRGAIRFDPEDVQQYIAATRPPPKPLIPASALRKYERLRRLAEKDGPTGLPELSTEQLAIAESRIRQMKAPPWANRSAIKAIYDEAKRRTRETGIAHDVDHIIPLLGEFVTGLHVETNLRVIPKSDNIAKSNKVPEC